MMLLLFDYDGVIVDSFQFLLDLCVEAQVAAGAGRPPVARDFRTIENLTFQELGRTIGLRGESLSVFCRCVFELQQSRWPVSPFPGVVEALKELSAGNRVAVVTSSKGACVGDALKAMGLGGAVSTVSGGETGESKAARITRLLVSEGFSPEDTYMIGDTVGDIRAGKLAGTRTAGVTWGFQSRQRLLKEQPDELLDSPAELVAIGK